MKRFVILFSLLFLISCQAATTQTTTITTEEDTRAEVLSNILDQASSITNLYGVTVNFNGEMIGEHYYGNYEGRFKRNVFSVTKSVMSLLVGIAIDQGLIENVNQSIADYIDLSDFDNEEELAEITIFNLLTMTQGLYWSSDLSSEIINLRNTEDPLDYVLDRNFRYDPGLVFNYSGGSSHLISIILKSATGMTALEYAELYLFGVLDIENAYWNTDALGVPIGGCDLYLTSRDMDKIGDLILNNGYVNDVQVVSESWLQNATTNQIGDIAAHDYGYYFWLSTFEDHDVIMAKGWGGQLIVVVQDLNLVITTLANAMVNDTQARAQFVLIENLVLEDILPLFS